MSDPESENPGSGTTTEGSRTNGAPVLLIGIIFGVIVIVALTSVNVHPIQWKAKANKVLQHGKQIALALRSYDGEFGEYPIGESANDYFGKLIVDLESEKIFYVVSSPWHGKNSDTAYGPDNLWEASDPPGVALDAGENAYAVNQAVTVDSPDDTPHIFAAIKDGRKTYCILVYADGSGEVIILQTKDDFRPGDTSLLKHFPNADWLLPVPAVE